MTRLGHDPLVDPEERSEDASRRVEAWKQEHSTRWALLVVLVSALLLLAVVFGGIILAVLIARALVSAVNWAWHL